VLKEPRITRGEPDFDPRGKGTLSGTAMLGLADGQHSQPHSRGSSSDATSGYHYSVDQSLNQSANFYSGLSGATTARTTNWMMSVDDVWI